ncbi:copper-binding periplasmic metallochaperone CueP [Intrasporangium sp.]|uniref:copper-binding periplasmic metallochaperone CueP n=1 Tax=Intrasporangium sp. TaxID=1925024 RepID=UPI003221CA92
MTKLVVAVLAAVVLALAGCSNTATPDAPAPAADSVVHQLGFDGRSAEQIVQAVDSSPEARPLGFGASVRDTQLVLTAGERESSLPLPADRFYLSIAPYRTQTHECFFHSLATCQGELAGADVTVTIVDARGKVLVDEQTTTYANGFVGFWLPRDVTGTVTVTHDGRKGSVPFATTAGSPTCLTTLRLTEQA